MTPGRRRAVVLLAACLGIGLTVSLGVWQLHRADAKHRAREEMLKLRAQTPWRAADWPCRPASDDAMPDLPEQKPVMLKGRWLADKTVFLDNRPMDGATGLLVITPLRMAGDEVGCPGGIVLVQRGWVPRDPQDRTHLPVVPQTVDEVQVVGRVMRTLPRTYQLGSEPLPEVTLGPVLRQNVNASFWARWLGQAPLAGAVLQTQVEQPAPRADLLSRAWPEPGFGEDRHLGYAAQWFALATLIAGLTVWFQFIRPRLQAHSNVSS